MQRAILLITASLFLLSILVSLPAASLALPGDDNDGGDIEIGNPLADYCNQILGVCNTQCEQYSFEIFGVTVVSPRQMGCYLECSVGYVGCMTRRFHQGW